MKRIFSIIFTLVICLFTSSRVYSQRPPVKAAFTESPSIGCGSPHTVFFTDLSENPDIWRWNFGDGSTSTSKNPIHTYTSAGSFNVRLFVQDTINGDSDEITRTITIGVSTVNFNASKTFGCGPLTTDFMDISSIDGEGSIVSRLWDFGDGTTSVEQNPSHIYNNPGMYTVSLTIETSLGCINTTTKTNLIQAIGPEVEFGTTSPRQLDGPGSVTFKDQTFSGSPIDGILWDFGDGGTSTNFSPTHTYTTEGVFDVSLTVKDFDGCSSTLTKANYVNTIAGAYDVSKAIFTGDHERFSVRFQESSPISLAFSADGAKMFVLGLVGREIKEYTLANAWDVSTASYAGDAEALSISSQEGIPTSLAFSSDGTKLFVIGYSGDNINEYSLTIAWDVSTATYAGDTERFSVASQESTTVSLAFSSEGTKMFVMGIDGQDINEYNLSTAWDVSTASYAGDGERFSVAAQESEARSLAFNGDGTKMFVLGLAGDDINEYNLANNWDVSTATYAGNVERLSVASEPVSLAFSADGAQMYVMNINSRNINQYSLAAPVITNAVGDQELNDNETISPFASIIVQDPNDDNVTAFITLDDNAKGILTGAGLTGTGPYTLASADAATLQANLRALVFLPTENRVATGSTEKTTFSIEVSDGKRSDTDNITTVISSPVGPATVISSTATSPTNGFDIAITFSENVTGFTVEDITVANGTAGNLVATSASVYNATITPTNNGTVAVDVTAAVAQDVGGADNTKATQFNISADVIEPDVVITSSVVDPTNGAFTTTFTFSEEVTGFDITDITVDNGTAASFVTTSASVYTAEITPTTDGIVTVDVAANVAEDAATNGNTAASQFSVEADFTAPTLTISSNPAEPTNGVFTATFTFSEEVTDFELTDITLGNGTAGSFTATSASVYTAEITPATNGTVTVDVASNVAEDAATNGNTAASQLSVEADLTAPFLIISSTVADPTNGAFLATFTFSEEVTGFDITEITVDNGIAGSLKATSASVYTAEITPITDGSVTVDVAAKVAEDAATNGNTAASQFIVEADLTAPTLIISSTVSDPTNDAFTATFNFSEEVTGFDVTDITVDNGTAASFVAINASVYSAEITPTTDGTVTVDVASNVAEDAASNGNTAAIQFSVEADLTVPTLTISSDVVGPTNGAFTATFTFSEGVTGFDITDITVDNGTAASFVAINASVYSAEITPTTDGTVKVDVASNVAEDAASNGNTAASQFSMLYDGLDPSVRITSSLGLSTSLNSIPVTITFSEEVTNFTMSDIAVGNGSAANFTTSDNIVFSANINPAMDGNITVDIASAIAQDLAGNDNTAATTFQITYDSQVDEIICRNTTIQLDANGTATLQVDQIDNGSSDSFGIASRSIDITSFNCSHVGDNNVTLTITDNNGNVGTCVAIVTVKDTILPMVITKDITVALDVNGQASITPADIDNGSKDNCGIATLTLDVNSFDIPKTKSTTVTLTVTDVNGNRAAATAIVTFAKMPQNIVFDPLPDKKVGQDPVLLQATGGGSGLPVTFSMVTEPTSGVATLIDGTIMIEGPGSVVITASQEGNDIFMAAEDITQSFEISSNELFLPTLFTPNNDGTNDRFVLRGGGDVANIDFQIFDRNGNTVFNSQEVAVLFQTGWDGTNDGKAQPQGAYIWVIKGSFNDGSPLLINGKSTGIIKLVR